MFTIHLLNVTTGLDEASELAVKQLRRFAIGRACRFCGNEAAERFLASGFWHGYARFKSTVRHHQDTLETGSVVSASLAIPQVLRSGTDAKVGATVIEAVAVDMVNDHAFRGAGKKAMEKFHAPAAYNVSVLTRLRSIEHSTAPAITD